MAVEWIRNNMLLLDNERNRQLTEAELKVQQSLQKLSIPDLYLNKCSNPPKILNVMPIENRLPPWKNSTSRRNCTSNSSSSDSIDISPHVKENVRQKAKKVAPPITSYKKKIFCQQMLPETKRTGSSTKSSSPKEEILDVNIPIMKFPRKISKTFPKMSPSRKIQNLNLVLPPGPKIELSKDVEDMCNDDYNSDDSKKTFVLKERPFNVDGTTKTEDLKNVDVIIDKRRENRQTNVNFQASEVVTTPLNAPDVKPNFVKYHAKSTPKSSQASEVVTTPLNAPDVKPNFVKYHAKSTLKSSQASEVVMTPLNAPDVKPNFVKYHAKSTPKSSQASEVVRTPLNAPNVKPFFVKYHAKSTPKSSQASEVVTTPLNAPDVKPLSVKYHAKSTLKSSQASEVMTTPLNAPDVKPNFVKYHAKSTPKSSQASEVVRTPLNAPNVKPFFVEYHAKSTLKSSQASEVMTTPLNAPDVKPNFVKYHAKSTPKSSQASEVVRTPLNAPNVKPFFVEYHAKSTLKSFQASEFVTTPLNAPNVKPNFVKYHAKSTPKSSQASEVVTTPLNAPDVKPNFVKYHAKSTPKSSQASEVVRTPLNAPDVKPKFFKLRANSTPKSSQAHLFSSAIIENSPKENLLTKPREILSPSILEKSLIFENKSMNVSNRSENIRRSKKVSPNLLEKTFIFEKSSTHNSFKESSNPIDLELSLRSKILNCKKNIVREIVRNLDEGMRRSLQPCHSQDDDKECFVKQIVNVLEKGNISRMRSVSSRSSINDEDSTSESETKSYVTSNSLKETDYSDYGRRSPTLNSDKNQTLNSECVKKDTLEVKEKSAEDDSVYWISISRYTLPRSSSLLSINSRLSSNGHSPCISPIKSPNEVEYSLQTSWGATYKTSNPLCKKLFHETAVIDSGYSD
ncbi:probable GPI-anchored adhesin-like protein PGA55 [Bombus pyrosoma]|uniref:probable GPI-anchored adhesin-like protein PGA55 n=1 Tax=Bombus pyrosoma TaxID=396416 RepID=UPI001CB8BA43|nr:probable GPI-anchored adhesin-like protein PGA55 [Bombus pyrosoma]